MPLLAREGDTKPANVVTPMQATTNGGTGTASTADYGPALVKARARYAEELKDPDLRRQLFARVASENGGAGATAQIESMINRGIARGQSLREVMGGAYWAKDGTANMQRMLASGKVPDFSSNINEVMGGSNVTNFSTGNASYAPNNPRFNQYPFGEGGVHTAKVNGELYGQEAGTVGWYKKLGIDGDASVGTGTPGGGGISTASATGAAGTASATGPAGEASATVARPAISEAGKDKKRTDWQSIADALSGFGDGGGSGGGGGGRAAGTADAPIPESVSPVAAPNLVSVSNWSALRGVLDGIA